MAKQAFQIAVLAGLALLTGGAALAETRLTIDVPFTFHTTNAQLPAGKYEMMKISGSSTFNTFKLRNMATGKSVALAAQDRFQRSGSDKWKAAVAFRCAGTYCMISEIYDRAEQFGYGVPTAAKLKRVSQEDAVATIRIPADVAE